MKRSTPNFKAATYVDIQKHWRRLGPIYKSPKAFSIWKPCMVEFMECKGYKNHQEEERHKLPSGYDCRDWTWDKRGPYPAFWNFVCFGACHWLVDLNLFVAASAWPKVPWRILNASKHSTVWNGDYLKPVLFDANWLVFEVTPEETLRTTWRGRRPAKFLKSYLHHQTL